MTSFVSVTQKFNSTTSMGRLTLNMLLSFAQFERIAASKAKGMWMGGNVPLGYDVKERKLVINEAEASTGYDDAQVIEIVLHLSTHGQITSTKSPRQTSTSPPSPPAMRPDGPRT